MTRLAFSLCLLLLASLSASPASAQYSYSGSAGALRTAPPLAKDKAATTQNRAASPTAPSLTGQMNRMSPQAAEGQRVQGPPKPPTSARLPLNSVPGQARPVPGVAR